MEPAWKRDVEFHEGWDLCWCGGGGGGSGIDSSGGGVGVGGSGGSSGVGDSGESAERLCKEVVEVVGVLCIGVVEVDCTGVFDIMVLGGVFVVGLMEEVELVFGCVVRLVLWCANGRGYFLCCFNLMSVEVNGLSVGGCLFGMVIWVDFLLLERKFLVVEVVVVEAVDVAQAGFFAFSRSGCLGDLMDVKVVIEVVVGVVVLV